VAESGAGQQLCLQAACRESEGNPAYMGLLPPSPPPLLSGCCVTAFGRTVLIFLAPMSVFQHRCDAKRRDTPLLFAPASFFFFNFFFPLFFFFFPLLFYRPVAKRDDPELSSLPGEHKYHWGALRDRSWCSLLSRGFASPHLPGLPASFPSPR